MKPIVHNSQKGRDRIESILCICPYPHLRYLKDTVRKILDETGILFGLILRHP
jgi:hypothetical protein